MTPAKRSVFCFALSLCFLSGIAREGSAVNFNNNCQDRKWFTHCGDSYNETNWEGDVIPSPLDHAVIDAQYSSIEVNCTELQATVLSVQAPAGLSLIGLTLTSGSSAIGGLWHTGGEIYANVRGQVLQSRRQG